VSGVCLPWRLFFSFSIRRASGSLVSHQVQASCDPVSVRAAGEAVLHFTTNDKTVRLAGFFKVSFQSHGINFSFLLNFSHIN
jgi:hypothetical protein